MRESYLLKLETLMNFSLHRYTKFPRFLTTVTAVTAACAFTAAHAETYFDQPSFSTKSSLWGTDDGWDFSKFYGGKWGTFNGDPAEGFNFSLGSSAAGLNLGVASSGQVGIVTSAQANGGRVNFGVTMEEGITLPDKIFSGRAFRVEAITSLSSGAMYTQAPFFKASIDGVINIDNKAYAEGCLVYICAGGEIPLNIDIGRFPIVSLDSTKPNPISILGSEGTIGQYSDYRAAGKLIGYVNEYPLTNVLSRNTSRTTVTLDSNQTVMSAGLNVTGILQNVLGIPTEISASYKVAEFHAIAVSLTADMKLNLSQSLRFTPTVNITLNFDQPVSTLDAEGNLSSTGNSATFASNGSTYSGADLIFSGLAGNLLSRTYSINGSFLSNSETLSLIPGIDIYAGCFEASAVGLGSTGTHCAYKNYIGMKSILNTEVHASSVAVNSFRDVTYAGNASDVTPVPEPSTWAITMAGLLVIAAYKKRKPG